MSFNTEADKARYEAADAIKRARSLILKALDQDTPGSRDFTDTYTSKMLSALRSLIHAQQELGL